MDEPTDIIEPAMETGVLVKRVSYGSSCYGVVEAGHVIHSIDGHDLANNETVRYGGTRTRLGVLLGERFAGERVPIRGFLSRVTCCRSTGSPVGLPSS